MHKYLILLFISVSLGGLWANSREQVHPLSQKEYWKNTKLGTTELNSLLRDCDKSEMQKTACNRALLSALALTENSEATQLRAQESIAEKFKYLQAHLPQNISTAEFAAASLNAFFSTYDPHSRLRPKQYFQDLISSDIEESNNGLSVHLFKNQTVVTRVLEKSAAYRSGLEVGDIILKVDGTAINDANFLALKNRLALAADQKLKLLVKKNSSTQQLTLEKINYTQPSLQLKIVKTAGKSLGYIRINTFQRSGICNEVADSIERVNAQHVQGIILDVRDNPGGLVAEAACTLGLFIGGNQSIAQLRRAPLGINFVPITKISTEQEHDTLRTSGTKKTNLPLIVIINNNSASAAELVAGALQDYHRAIVVGVRSFGKGTVQSAFYPWENKNLYLMQTTHQFFLPSGKSPQRNGVEPDIIAYPRANAKLEEQKYLRESELYPNSLPASDASGHFSPRNDLQKIHSCVEKTVGPRNKVPAQLDYPLLVSGNLIHCI